MHSSSTTRFFSLLFCLFSGFAFSQNGTFQKKIGAPAGDDANAVLETADGYLFAGKTFASGNNQSEASLIYTDKDGAIIWQKRYGGVYAMNIYTLAAANDGGFIAWGSTVNVSQSFSDGWLMKVDASGNMLWQQIIGESDFSESPTGNIVVMPDGYILSGVKIRAGYSQSFVFRTDNDGNTLWSSLTPSGDYSQLHLSYLADSLLYLTGTVNNVVCWRSMDPATGTIVQSQEYQLGSTNWFYKMHLTPEGDHLITGYARFDSSGVIQNKGWVQKVNSAGQIIWSKTYQSLYRNIVNASTLLPDGSVIIALTYAPFLNINANNLGLVKIDANGAVVWTRSFGSDEFLQIHQLIQTTDSGLLALGLTVGSGGPFNTEMFILKTDSLGQLDGCCAASIPVIVQDVTPVFLQEPFTTTNFVTTGPFQDAFEALSDLQGYDFCSNQQPVSSKTIQFCPGDSVVIAGVSYYQPDTVTALLPSSTGDCDTLVTYILELLANPVLQETIQFCPGETVTIAGVSYDQPGTVTAFLPSTTGGCDTLATYLLEYASAGQTSTLDLICPVNIVGVAPSGANGLSVNYNPPVAASDCICPGTQLDLVTGSPSGSVFPVGINTICYQATDACGTTKSCCFQVTVQQDIVCDVKTSGCLKFELLQINRNSENSWVYYIRVTNNCSDALKYFYVQVPTGMQASEPAGNSYVAPSGASYTVRNPNYTPFYSIRFKPDAPGLANGQSDVFRYVLPAQVDVRFINVGVRLESGNYHEAHLNIFFCAVGAELAAPPVVQRSVLSSPRDAANTELSLSPNPVSNNAYAQLQGGYFPTAVLVLQDLQGRTVLERPVTDNQLLLDHAGLAPGLYIFHVLENGVLSGSGKVVVGQ